MSQTSTIPNQVTPDTVTTITVESEPIRIPKYHQEDLGPISDSAPETWRYDPDRLENFFRHKPLQVLGRFINIAFKFSRFLLTLKWDKITNQTTKNQKKRAIQLRKLLTQLGPTYIKIGQALSTRPDLVAPLYLDELTKLQDQLPCFPNEIAYHFIEEELNAPPEEIYAEISAEPIAAASLGQVYKGKLKTGETVAIKVQRPDLIKRIAIDIYIMRSLAQWAQKNIKRVRSDLVGITDELATRIFEEMNYVQEGHNAEKFAKLYGYLPEIYIPKIYWEYTGRRVLTMEWIVGTKLTNIQEIQSQGIDATHIVEVGVECSLRQLLEDGFFHADPHPGNLLATPDGKLAYLDFGMMSNIKPHQRYGLIEAIVHLVNRDFEALAKDYVQLEFLKPETDLTPIVPALSDVFNNALVASVAELNFKSITDRMSAMMYEFPFRVPAYYALIIRSMVTLEGIAIGIDPNFKVLSKAYPYVAKRLLSDPSPELRNSLKDLLFKDGSFRWNRLENLLRNARNSQDYDIEKVVNQAVDFIFSERGTFIRERLVDEIINSVDVFGRRTLFNISSSLQKQIGLETQEIPQDLQGNSQNIEHIKNIWEILQNTQGFDPMQLIPLIPQLLTKNETQKMGQKIAEGLAQKVAARLIRKILLDSNASNNNRSVTPIKKPLMSLPDAIAAFR
jgi:predicted unusual protein kinase regulating ubiquinone biosynthesis (AarF/ABC1/UbiB family)